LKKRIALAVALLTVVCVAALTWLAYVKSEKALRTSILRESATALSQTGLQIDLTLENTKRDVLFLAGTPPMRGIQRARRAGGYDAEAHSTYDMWVERLQEIMISLLRNKPDYWQARYIDERGQERVRVDSLNGRIAAVPRRALQNKAEYAYFTETMKLVAGAIYVSPLNLNREHGQIEAPHRPTLRLATPIIDVLGKRQGIVVINLHAKNLLDSIRGPIQTFDGRPYMVDQDGFFLSHPDPGKTFGFDLGLDYRLRNIHPRLAEHLAGQKQFVEYADNEGQQGLEPHIHGFRKIAYDRLDPRRYWAVILDLPAATAFAPVYALRSNLLGLGAVIAVLGAFLGMVWARRFARQAEVLTATAGEIARGRTDLRVDPNHMVDEFRTLGDSFNRMVESLLAAEARSTNIVNYASDAIVTADEDQRIRGFNRGAERIFGYSAGEVIGRPLDILLPDAGIETHRQHMHNFAAQPEQARAMGRNRRIAGRRKDGSEFPAEANVSKLRENGHWVFTAFLRDITERKRAEQALQEKEALLSTVGTMAKVGGWEFDTRTLKGTWTDEVARIHDMDPKEETGVEQGLRFYVAESREKIEAAIKDAIEHGKPYDLELEMITAKGNHKWVRTVGQPVKDGDTVVKVMGSFQDITERKLDEEEIRRLNTELERKVIERSRPPTRNSRPSATRSRTTCAHPCAP
jgi:PAS domain S-box-containing protein